MHKITITLLKQDGNIDHEALETALAKAVASIKAPDDNPVVQDAGGFDLFIEETKA